MNVKKKTPWAMPRLEYMLVDSVSRKAGTGATNS
jgi:hypothetical protein